MNLLLYEQKDIPPACSEGKCFMLSEYMISRIWSYSLYLLFCCARILSYRHLLSEQSFTLVV